PRTPGPGAGRDSVWGIEGADRRAPPRRPTKVRCARPPPGRVRAQEAGRRPAETTTTAAGASTDRLLPVLLGQPHSLIVTAGTLPHARPPGDSRVGFILSRAPRTPGGAGRLGSAG